MQTYDHGAEIARLAEMAREVFGPAAPAALEEAATRAARADGLKMPTAGEVRSALDALELAVIGLGLRDLTDGWGEPRHRPELGVRLRTTAGIVYEIDDAMAEAGRVINYGS